MIHATTKILINLFGQELVAQLIIYISLPIILIGLGRYLLETKRSFKDWTDFFKEILNDAFRLLLIILKLFIYLSIFIFVIYLFFTNLDVVGAIRMYLNSLAAGIAIIAALGSALFECIKSLNKRNKE